MSTILQALRRATAAVGATTKQADDLLMRPEEYGFVRELRALIGPATGVALLGWLLGAGLGQVAGRVAGSALQTDTAVRTVSPSQPAAIAALPKDAGSHVPGRPQSAKRVPQGATPERKQEAAEPTALTPTRSGPAKRAVADGRKAFGSPKRSAVKNESAAEIVGPPLPDALRLASASPPAVAIPPPGLSSQPDDIVPSPSAPQADPAVPVPLSPLPVPTPEIAAASQQKSSPPLELAAVPIPLFQQPVTVDGGASIEVLGNQHISVNGEATSLRSVVEEICRQAGVELRAYAAADRRYVGHLQNLPLQEAFRSLFRSESYLVGLTFDEASRETRITWLQVMGATAGTGPAATGAVTLTDAPKPPTLVRPSPRPQQKFVLSPTLLYEAFGTMDPARREQAQHEALQRLIDPAQQAAFLETDSTEIANVVGSYEHAAEGMRSMKRASNQPHIRNKIDEVLSILDTMGNAASRD